MAKKSTLVMRVVCDGSEAEVRQRLQQVAHDLSHYGHVATISAEPAPKPTPPPAAPPAGTGPTPPPPSK